MVDFPLVPVTNIDLKKFFIKKIKSMSVIIFSSNFSKLFFPLIFFKLMPGLNIMKSTISTALFKFSVLFFLYKSLFLSSHTSNFLISFLLKKLTTDFPVDPRP